MEQINIVHSAKIDKEASVVVRCGETDGNAKASFYFPKVTCDKCKAIVEEERAHGLKYFRIF